MVPVEPVQALLWGLATSASLEHPEWRFTCIDLSPEQMSGELDVLAAELGAEDDEDQIALRPSGRFAARLRAAAGGADDNSNGASREGRVLQVANRGVFDSVGWAPAVVAPPGAGQVQVAVDATALNFRDVLNALGLYPGTPPLGSECVGNVTAVGAGVTSVAPGDRVMAIGAGSFASHVTVRDGYARRWPSTLTAAEAVTVPIAFVTAVFGLQHVAALRRSERVLIHAAAGGVGLAAVQVAQRIGAEVFATAGTPEKRDYLTRLGVKHVMDSRTTTFADQIRQATGGARIDVVLNSLIGESIGRSLDVMARGGRFVELGKRDVWDPEKVRRGAPTSATNPWTGAKRRSATLSSWPASSLRSAKRSRAASIGPFPVRTFPASQVVEAFRFMAQGRHLGKIVVTSEREDHGGAAGAVRRRVSRDRRVSRHRLAHGAASGRAGCAASSADGTTCARPRRGRRPSRRSASRAHVSTCTWPMPLTRRRSLRCWAASMRSRSRCVASSIRPAISTTE